MTKPDHFDRFEKTFDIEDPAFAEQFEDVLEHLVTKCPVAHSEVGPGYHVFNRYQDVRRCATDWRTFSSADGWLLNPPAGNLPILPEDLDPPYHTAWRRVLNPFFSPAAVGNLETSARRYAGELVDRFAPRGYCEYVAEFAAQLPGLILFHHIIPVPVDDLPTLFHDIDLYAFGPVDQRAAAFGRVHAYLEQFLAARRNEPAQHDLVDVLLAGVERDGEPCSWEDKVHTTLDVVFGGLGHDHACHFRRDVRTRNQARRPPRNPSGPSVPRYSGGRNGPSPCACRCRRAHGTCRCGSERRRGQDGRPSGAQLCSRLS